MSRSSVARARETAALSRSPQRPGSRARRRGRRIPAGISAGRQERVAPPRCGDRWAGYAPTATSPDAALIIAGDRSQISEMQEVDAEAAVLLEWSEWAPKNLPNRPRPTRADAERFFAYLQTEKPHLLSFEAHGDKWQVVHGWLQTRGFVID
jgi:hypothetical protein